MTNVTLVVFVSALLTFLATSTVWLTAYFVGVRPNISPSCGPDSKPKEKPLWPTPACGNECSYELVESIPLGMYENNTVPLKSTYSAWMELLDLANSTIDIAQMYWNLLDSENGGKETDESAQEGKTIFNGILAKVEAGVGLRITADSSNSGFVAAETNALAQAGAMVRTLNFTKLIGSGILHTKFWLVDGKHLYLGSANHDWKSLTQVKEMGVLVKNCPCLANDLQNVFEIYFKTGTPDYVIPVEYPQELQVSYNSQNPISARISNDSALIYITSSPPPLVPTGREHDLATVLRNINNAREYVYISVMDYIPATLYKGNENLVQVKLLVSKWPHTRKEAFSHFHSLRALDHNLPCVWDREQKKCKDGSKGALEIKVFECPPYKANIPYTRVNHAKFMVSDKTAFIGTSNWSADYFLWTAGVSMVVRSEQATAEAGLVRSLRDVFERDWNSAYATSIDQFDENGSRKQSRGPVSEAR